MKYIFDFDDVLIRNTSDFKPHLFGTIAKFGVPEDAARTYYLQVNEKEFSLRNFISSLFLKYNINQNQNAVYQSIMEKLPKFINTELIDAISKTARSDRYIITNGEKEFNQDKLDYSGVNKLFLPKNIFIVPATKKGAVEKICSQNSDSKIFFIDDKQKFLDDLDLEKCPNLKTVHFTSNALLRVALPHLFQHK